MARANGFTVVELIVVLAILGILAAIATPLLQMSRQREREADLKHALWEIRGAIDAWHDARAAGAFGPVASMDGQAPYPPDLVTLTKLVPDLRPDHRGEMLRFLRRVPRDPFADRALPAERTWVTRSYFSEANRPRPGGDVYDVSSGSAGTGLDGVPLKDW